MAPVVLAGAGGCVVALGGGGARAGAGAAHPGVHGVHARAPARILIYAQEWSLWSSRASLPAGRVMVQFWNRGQDAHDLRVRRLNAAGRPTGLAQDVSVTQSGGLSSAHWRLRPGRYELYCSLADHRARGMHAKLRVR